MTSLLSGIFHCILETKMQNANYLATVSGYAHLVEPGCLCTKQAL